jgi:hypothetical protein
VSYKFEAIAEFNARMENRSIANSHIGARDSCLSSSRRTMPPQKFHRRASDTSQSRAGFGTFARLHVRFENLAFEPSDRSYVV